ncbi:hypothetical protein IM660_17595 [Ruania alkalisoli]|uniref:Uncharacterized protein n=1 Tax=Ruania alkalisoli TaxID=2779775 RepID=A0A7M1SUE1_9MICO|nr:hypothetical protein [Ruania alkalisoli]QOR70382.1 hypothetical protein IM660_17595 [Ruania alkalisoli]
MASTGAAGHPESAAPLDLAAALARHLLALPDDVTVEEVEALALSRYPRAHWVADDVLQLEEETYLSGPFLVTAADRAELGLPVWAEHAYLLTCPPERGGPVPEELQAVGGLLAAFGQGSVEGMERAAVEVLCAMGRRLAGVVRTSTGHVLEPGPMAGVDLVVHAPVWLHPDALVHVLRPALPGVRLLAEPDPPRTLSSSANHPSNAEQLSVRPGVRELDEGERAWLHAEADAYDAHALNEPQVTEAYGAVSPYPDGGTIGVSVEAEVLVPLVLAGLEWAATGTIAYSLRWYPADPVALEQHRAGRVVLDQREDARTRIEAAARAIQAATDGEVTDDDQFLVQL